MNNISAVGQLNGGGDEGGTAGSTDSNGKTNATPGDELKARKATTQHMNKANALWKPWSVLKYDFIIIIQIKPGLPDFPRWNLDIKIIIIMKTLEHWS